VQRLADRRGDAAVRRAGGRRLVVVRSTSLLEVVADLCFDSLRRLLTAASSWVEQADGGLGHDCPDSAESGSVEAQITAGGVPEVL
jgi:hypothetical protein